MKDRLPEDCRLMRYRSTKPCRVSEGMRGSGRKRVGDCDFTGHLLLCTSSCKTGAPPPDFLCWQSPFRSVAHCVPCFPLFGFSINTLSMLGPLSWQSVWWVDDAKLWWLKACNTISKRELAPKGRGSQRRWKELSGPVCWGLPWWLASVVRAYGVSSPGITGRLLSAIRLTIAISVISPPSTALTLSQPLRWPVCCDPQSEEKQPQAPRTSREIL